MARVPTVESVTADVLDPKSLVDVTGYVPLEKRIEALLIAGQNLTSSRSKMYDTDKSDAQPSDVPPDPFRDYESDIVDLDNQRKDYLARAEAALRRVTEQQASAQQNDAQKNPDTAGSSEA